MQPFRIMWFEDDKQTVDDIAPSIEGHLKIHGRKLDLQWKDKYSKDFDVTMFEGECCLVIVDLNLNEGDKGTDLIGLIRKNGAFVEILLYSNNPDELRDHTEGKNYIEGIYRHATLTGLENRIKEIIDIALYREMMVFERLRKFEEGENKGKA